jgi:prepilin-type N-terminal cleavage/methylation domain-containing protein
MKNGFTLVELLLIMGIMAIISSFAVINLVRPQTKANLDSTLSVLISDLKSQQLKAMIGDGEGGAANSYGIYFESSRYTLFRGAAYNVSDPNNFVVNSQGGTTFFPTFAGSQVIFNQRSGEVANFSGSANTITVTSSGESKTITINALGTVSIN